MSESLEARLERIDARADLAALEREWRDLEQRATAASFFQSWSWMGPWLQMARGVAEVQLFRARRAERTVGLGFVVPWQYRRGGILPTRALCLNELRGDAHDMFIEYNGLLCEESCAAAVWTSLLQTLRANPLDWSELLLGGLPGAERDRVLAAAAGLYVGAEEQRLPWVAGIEGCKDLDVLLARYSRNRRWQIRRSMRHFEEQDGALSVAAAPDTADALAAFDQMGVLHTARWRREGQSGSWANPDWVGFQRAVIHAGMPRGEVQLLRVHAGTRLIGVVYNFLWRGRAYMLQTGFAEPRDNNERPGYVTHCLAMACNGALGMQEYDFMCGEADYKRSLATAQAPLHWLALRRDTPRNRLEDTAVRAWHRLRGDRGAGQVPVIVLGEGITALGVLRAFGRAGIPVYGAAGNDQVLRHSRHYRELPGLGDGSVLRADPDSLAAALQACGLERAVLCACTDHYCSAVAALPAALAARFPSCMPAADTLAMLNDKGRFGEMLGRIGVAHPFTRIVREPGDLAELEVGEPRALFLKPRDSQSFFAAFAVKAWRVASVADARARLEQTAPRGLEMVLQEYVPGGADQHYFIDGYRDHDGIVRALFARRRLRIFPPDFGNSTAMRSVPVAEVGQAARDLERLLAETRYHGIFSAEFKRDERDGSYRILEVNTRPWWYIDFAVRSGADVCRLMYEDALGRPLENIAGYATGARCIYPYYDIHALRQLRATGGRYSWLRWLAELARARQPVFAWDDPLPAIYASLRTLGWMRKP